MELLTFNELPQGGFAGLREKQFVIDQRILQGQKHPYAANGIGNFVYLADATFRPYGETRMHPHKEVDVISVMVEGRISHAGSLEHGQHLNTGDVQVQRAGGEGFTHNEINPDGRENNMIQLWVLPEQYGEPAGYKVYSPVPGMRTRIYGGSKSQAETFDSSTFIDVALLEAEQSISHEGEVIAYLAKGEGVANGVAIKPRTLIRTTGLELVAKSESQLILIYN